MPHRSTEPIHGLQIIFPNLIPQGILLSLGGNIYFNLSVDGQAVANPDALRRAYLDELREIGQAYGVACSELGDICDPTAQFLSNS
jgi:hypothetical protein